MLLKYLTAQARADIVSYTTEALLAALDRPRSDGLVAGSVPVIDEAGMVGTRELHTGQRSYSPEDRVHVMPVDRLWASH